MPKENLISDDVNLKTWQGYVAGLLENIRKDIENNKYEVKEDINQIYSSIEKVSDKVDDLNNELIKHSNCGIEDLKIAIFGDGKNGNGLTNKIGRLSTELRIKSGYWGIIGGTIPVLIVIAIVAIKIFLDSSIY